MSTSSTSSPRPQSGAFKPEDLAYHAALEKLGATDAWFVAGHWWDVAGATFAGLKTAWISRTDLAYPVAMPEPHLRGTDVADVAAKNKEGQSLFRFGGIGGGPAGGGSSPARARS